MTPSLPSSLQLAVLASSLLANLGSTTSQVRHQSNARSSTQQAAQHASGRADSDQGATPKTGSPQGANGATGTSAQEADTPLPSAFRNILYQPNVLAQGSPILFTVDMAQPASRISGRFAGRELFFFRGEKPSVWYALAGIDLESPPNAYDLSVTASVLHKGIVRATKKIDIALGDFKSGALDVPENFVNPDQAGKRQIAGDTVLKAHAYAHFLPTPQWSGDFKKPVESPSTPSFGMTRVLNEEMTSQHRGTDFPAKEGSPVSASNAGTVVLAKEMFYEGNCIILDHGQHFFTIYMHLSRMDVKVGDKVKRGAPLGLSGSTGRVTGPHLHMGVRWNGAYLDPVKLLTLSLPETSTVPLNAPGKGTRHTVTHHKH